MNNLKRGDKIRIKNLTKFACTPERYADKTGIFQFYDIVGDLIVEFPDGSRTFFKPYEVVLPEDEYKAGDKIRVKNLDSFRYHTAKGMQRRELTISAINWDGDICVDLEGRIVHFQTHEVELITSHKNIKFNF